ncbi:hypothetical protein B0T18DRAFT_466640 [Schizothecium vesticola]|uniref:Uncharacterized protein n=1 Tax=Schizothecium vesticola TaxID=314040 RepID=A0AA40EWW3_9PEZI|nr:hypothetical protein B0T18DRAFT_466640 [Schizothecium vesticola]
MTPPRLVPKLLWHKPSPPARAPGGLSLPEPPAGRPVLCRFQLHTDRRPVEDIRAVYVVPPPLIPDELAFMRTWSFPSGQDRVRNDRQGKECGKEDGDGQGGMDGTDETDVESSSPVNVTDSLFGYLVAHFHPLPRGTCTGSSSPTAPVPDGVFPQQIDVRGLLSSVKDFLDDELGEDGERAMAVMVVEQDLCDPTVPQWKFGSKTEQNPESVACSGASKVGYNGYYPSLVVVSGARHHPSLFREMDLCYVWPASHCRYSVEAKSRWREAAGRVEGSALGVGGTAMGAAMRAVVGVEEAGDHARFARIARALTKELGLCLGMDNCGYYACVM